MEPVKPAPSQSTFSVPTIMLSNARSLCNKLDEFHCVLNDNLIEIALISETWFTPEQPQEMMEIDGFTLFSKPRRGKPGGGVAVYVKDSLYARHLDVEVPSELECTWVYVRPTRLPREISGLAVCAVYLPPDSPHQDSLRDHLITTVDQLRAKYPDIGFHIGGDFNRMDTLNLCNNINMKQIVRVPTRQDAILDLIITNVSRFYKPCITIAPLGMSDHRSVLLHPKQHVKSNKTTKKLVRPMPDSRIRAFGAWISAHNWEEITQEEGSQAKTTALYNTLHQKINMFFPTRYVKLHDKDKPWMTPEIKSLISRRQSTFMQGKTSEWKALRNKIQTSIKRTKQSFYNDSVKNLQKQDPANWHKCIKTMANIGKSKATIHIEGILPDNAKATADIINTTLSKITQSLPPLDTRRLPAFLPSLQPPQVSVWEMYHKLQSVSTRKAAGPDNITGRLVKEFTYELSQPLTDILNTSLNEGRVPQEWHEATVIPLPKTKPPSVDELRPVSLTSILAKACEGFIAKWTLSDILTNIDQNQFGGIPGRSTTHCLVSILHQLSSTSDRRGTVSSVVLTDFSKAFDRVDHTTAITRLLDLGCRASLLPWICDFPSGRKQRVLYQNAYSEWNELTCGLPQGTVLAPIIFIALINNATKDSRANNWKFVDDLTLIESRLLREPSRLQEDLNGLDRWTTDSSMKLHPAKCKTMHVSFTRTPTLLPPLYINGHALQVVSVAKLLGVWVQANLKWDSHVNHVTKQSSKRLFLLRRLKKFRLSQKDLLTVYTCYVRPLLEYAAPVWSPGLTRTQSKQLENIQRRACRTILGTQYTRYSEACAQLNLPTLESRRDQLSRKFGRRLLSFPSFREWLPPSRMEISGRQTRTCNNLDSVSARTARFYNSSIPHIVRLLNSSLH
ncbi:hypothetical protein Bbelb_240720 [Branchiostoma belcheri]|nr:hypothetical protein Bbelb_240720 [Branchiostoma belcheri]